MTASPASRLLETFRHVERLPRVDMAFYQARLLEKTVRYARQHVPFYASRLQPAFDAEDVLDMDRWQDVPILPSQEAREAGEALRSDIVPPGAGKAIRDQTTGSSGSALHFFRSEAALIADAANSLRIFRDHRFDPESRFADLRIDIRGKATYPEGALRPSWSHGDGAGDYAILDISTPLEQQLEWLCRMRPSIIFTWPSNLRALALALEKSGESLPISALATSAESSTAGLRSDCERIFGAVPVDILGAREIGVIAWRCHAGLAYHLAAESALIEIIRDDGEPARRGETGRLVATPFYNLHTPFIRYETGDYITLACEPCVCGRSLPSISRICGRARGRLRLPDGRDVFPDVPEAALDTLIGPLEWRLVQDAIDHLAVYLQPEVTPCVATSSAQIEETVRKAFGLKMRVDFYPDRPPEVPRRKRELFVSTVSTRATAN